MKREADYAALIGLPWPPTTKGPTEAAAQADDTAALEDA